MSLIGKYVRPPARRLAAPLLRALDVRLANTAERLEAHTVNLARHHEAINEQIVNAYAEGLNTTRALVRTEGEAVGEYVLAMARIEERLTRAVEMDKVDALPRRLADVDAATMEYLSWLVSADGLLAQAGLDVAGPCELRVGADGVRIAKVDERVVVHPLVHALLAPRPSSRVLTVGSTWLSLELASLGHHVVALGTRPAPVRHPNLTDVAADVATWRGPAEPLDVAIRIGGPAPDLAELRRVASWLRDGGTFLLTVAFGRAGGDVHDDASLGRLVADLDLDLEERRVFRRVDATTWVPVAAEEAPIWTDDARGVALVQLRAR